MNPGVVYAVIAALTVHDVARVWAADRKDKRAKAKAGDGK